MSEQGSARHHLIDIARVLSVLVVVIFHCLLYQIEVVASAPSIVPWAPGVEWWIASWFFMIMPVFFVAGGFAHALVVDKMRARGGGYAHYLASRGRRLVGPLLLFVSASALVSTAGFWFGHPERSVELSRQFAQLLWFLTIYLLIVAVAPALVSAQSRSPWVLLGLLFVGVVGVDWWSFSARSYELRNLNLLLAWPLVHQLGIAYHRGWFRRGPVWQPLAGLMVGVAGVLVLVLGFGYPPSAVGLANIPIANVQPPTLAMVFLGVAQASALGLAERAGLARSVSHRVERILAAANALLVTAYLWHIPVILISGFGLFLLTGAFPAATDVLLSQPMVVAVTLPLLATLAPLIGRLEYRLVPGLGYAPRRTPTIAAFALLSGATALVWMNGAVLAPSQPWSSLGVVGLWLGALAMARAAGGSSAVARVS
ncbi:MAG: acyltransferase family protein [Micropruina sp.]|nr:acyltransferase family protein [Micropruina sp.]